MRSGSVVGGDRSSESAAGESAGPSRAAGKTTRSSELASPAPAVQRRAATVQANVQAAPAQRADDWTLTSGLCSALGLEAPAAPASVEPARGASVQRRASGASAEGSDAHAAARQGIEGAGSALPHLDAIQFSFGSHDVSGISAHVGGAAAQASRTLGAEAYATGNDVAFRQQPDLHTAAHEAAHVVQQRAGVQLKGGFGEVGDVYEQHADAVADRVVRGESAQAMLDQFAGQAGAAPATQRLEKDEPEPGSKSDHGEQLRGLLALLQREATATSVDAEELEQRARLRASLPALQQIADGSDRELKTSVYESLVAELASQGVSLSKLSATAAPAAAPAPAPAVVPVQKRSAAGGMVVQFLGWEDLTGAVKAHPVAAAAVTGVALVVGWLILRPRVPTVAERVFEATGVNLTRVPSDFERKAIAFEERLAPVAVAKSDDIGGTMCVKALDYMTRQAADGLQDQHQLKAKVDALVTKCGLAAKSFAGAVGTDPDVIRQILVTAQQHRAALQEHEDLGHQAATFRKPPSVREQLTFIRNFGREVLAPDLLTKGSAKVGQYMQSTEQQTARLEARIQAANAAAALRQGAATNLDIVDAVPANQGAQIVKGTDDQADLAAEARNPLAIEHQKDARIDVTDVRDLQTPARTANGTRKARWDADRTAEGNSKRTAGSLPAALALTDREKAHQGINADQELLKWCEGEQVWYANEKNAWVKAIRALEVPFAGGPSGLTNSVMNAVQMLLGGDLESMKKARLALIGHLSHIHAHTAVEVLAASAGFGLPFTAGPTMYTDIPPLSVPELRACGRPGGVDGTLLFPHEPDPVMNAH